MHNERAGKNKIFCFILIFIFSNNVSIANMGTPFYPGTHSSTIITSKNFDILSENILIKIDKNFKTAKYIIEYKIKADTNGIQVPFLFVAMDLLNDFKITFDGLPINLQNIKIKYEDNLDTSFASFASNFSDSIIINREYYSFKWNKSENRTTSLDDLKYFKLDISQGIHIIQIEYVGKIWVDETDWVQKFSFRYSLSPAKYWRSFNELNLEIDASEWDKSFTTNLDQFNHTSKNKIYKWKFNRLPDEYIIIEYTPEISFFAKFLTLIGPLGLILIFASLFTYLSYYLNKKYRRTHYQKRFSPIVFITAFISPIVFMLFMLLSYHLINYSIGENATDNIPYMGIFFILPLFLTVIVMPVYLSILWYWDWVIRDNFRDEAKKNEQNN